MSADAPAAVGQVDATDYQYQSDQIDPDRPSLSRSIIKTMCNRSPAHAKAEHPRLNPDWEYETKTSFDIGTAAHEVLLAGESTVDVIAGFDDWKKKDAQEQRAVSRSHGRIPLLEKEWAHVEPMVASARAYAESLSLAVPMFEDGIAEQTLTWEEGDVLCRARPDWLGAGVIDDFKTTTDASPESFSRAIVQFGYDIQSLWYQRGVRAALGVESQFRILAVEKKPPYAATVWQIAPDAVSLAHRKIEWAIRTWRECLHTGLWPGYSSQVLWANLEPWHEPRWLDKEARVAA